MLYEVSFRTLKKIVACPDLSIGECLSLGFTLAFLRPECERIGAEDPSPLAVLCKYADANMRLLHLDYSNYFDIAGISDQLKSLLNRLKP